MKYRILDKKEKERAIIRMIDILLDPTIPYAGSHRKQQWENGWAENLKELDITPRYFGKYNINRLRGKLIQTYEKNFELKKLYSILDVLAKQYLNNVKDIYEFGCGTGHNLLRVRSIVNTEATLHGLDWATSSQKILKTLSIDAHNFDFFNPSDLKLVKNSGVYTVAALEQTGTDYKKFVKYLLKNKPSVVIHIEPIPELLDPTNLLDYLSIKYMEKRKYLSGYLVYLKELEREGKIKIIEARRSGIGSLFIDGYSIIVWKPI